MIFEKGKLYWAIHKNGWDKRILRKEDLCTGFDPEDVVSFAKPKVVVYLGTKVKENRLYYHLIIDDKHGWITITDMTFKKFEEEEEKCNLLLP